MQVKHSEVVISSSKLLWATKPGEKHQQLQVSVAAPQWSHEEPRVLSASGLT